jgi:sulfite reductase alpha subunit-like flavoprotein
MTTREEKINILYGSQTGNSEQLALDLCSQVPTQLGPAQIQKITGTSATITVVPKCMQLDDFLEIDRAEWTRLVVIVTSSYGVGQAPLGCYRFRELCDAWKKEGDVHQGTLEGMTYALCGLGDSKYTTFFRNPTVIDEALRFVGAKRVGPLGKADASGPEDQTAVLDKWLHSIWPFLAKVVAEPPLDRERLQQMQQRTVQVCQRINPDFEAKAPSSQPLASNVTIVLLALLAIILGYYFTSTTK